MKRLNFVFAVLFILAVLAIAVVAYDLYRRGESSSRAAREYNCSLAYAVNSVSWQNCVNSAQ